MKMILDTILHLVDEDMDKLVGRLNPGVWNTLVMNNKVFKSTRRVFDIPRGVSKKASAPIRLLTYKTISLTHPLHSLFALISS